MGETPRVYYTAAPSGPAMFLLQLHSWKEAFLRHWHEEWGIAVIEQGINRFWSRGAWHDAGPGNILVVPSGEVHDGGLDRDSVWGERMFDLPIDSLARITEAHTGRTQEAHLPGPIIEDQVLAGSLVGLHRWRAFGGKTIDPLEASEQQVSCFGSLVARYGNAEIYDREAHPASIRAALELLHDQPNMRITIEELAAGVGLSPFHLIRAFRRRVGVPSHAYLKQLRITLAQRFLRAGPSISDAPAEIVK